MKTPGLKVIRRTCQIGCALFFLVLPYLNAKGFSELSGNFLSFNLAGFKLCDPLAGLLASLGGAAFEWTLVLGIILALMLAAWLGAVFCSWLCPFGLLSELTYGLAKRWRPAPKGKAKPGFAGKLLLGASLFILILLGGLPPLLNQLSLPGWYARLFQTWLGQDELSLAGLVLLGLLALEFFACRRLWCRYVCPQSLLLLLAQRASPFGPRPRFTPSRCICKPGSELCLKSCSLELDPRAPGRAFELECSNCGDCHLACRQSGRALDFGGSRKS